MKESALERSERSERSERPRVVTFGEIMLRLSPPGHERLLQSPMLSATFGGGEANVAVSLAHFGLDSWFVTRLPAHAVGDAVVRCLRGEGVRTDHVLRGGGRLGIYFAETGASQRASTVIYDRAHSAVAGLSPGMIDWPGALEKAAWLHLTGITPALGPDVARVAAEAVAAARAAGASVSVDLNFRRKLWSEKEAQATMRPLVGGVDVIIANEEDLQATLGFEVPGADVSAGRVEPEAYRSVATRVATDLGARRVAVTLRESLSASDNGWSAILWDADAGSFHVSQRYDVRVVDRIGGGDSFAAGLIYGLLSGRGSEASLRFAVAASALKQTIPGDFNRVSVEEVDRLVRGDASGRVRR
jgi:2-dehydro-3-deoxygluconokinase